jgi:hypothetical protein
MVNVEVRENRSRPVIEYQRLGATRMSQLVKNYTVLTKCQSLVDHIIDAFFLI